MVDLLQRCKQHAFYVFSNVSYLFTVMCARCQFHTVQVSDDAEPLVGAKTQIV